MSHMKATATSNPPVVGSSLLQLIVGLRGLGLRVN